MVDLSAGKCCEVLGRVSRKLWGNDRQIVEELWKIIVNLPKRSIFIVTTIIVLLIRAQSLVLENQGDWGSVFLPIVVSRLRCLTTPKGEFVMWVRFSAAKI